MYLCFGANERVFPPAAVPDAISRRDPGVDPSWPRSSTGQSCSSIGRIERCRALLLWARLMALIKLYPVGKHNCLLCFSRLNPFFPLVSQDKESLHAVVCA